VVVDQRGHLAAFGSEPGSKVLYRDDEIAVVRTAEAKKS